MIRQCEQPVKIEKPFLCPQFCFFHVGERNISYCFVVFRFYFINALQGDDNSNYRVYVLGHKSQVLTWSTMTT